MLLLAIKINVLFTILHLAHGAINWNGNNWAFNCDWRGNDLSNARVSGDQCGGLCAQTSGCTHFTWTTYNGGTCWMKSGSVSKADAFDTNDNSMVCGLLNDQPNNGNGINWTGDWAFNCDWSGNDLSSAQIPGEQCGDKCAQTSGCTHFTWTTYNGGTCWMKSGTVSKSDAVKTNDNSMVCGLVNGPGPTPSPPSGNKFPYCKFRFGAEQGNRDFSKVDYITAWIGYDSNINNDMIQACINNKKLPLYYAYITAFMARNSLGAQDCDVAGNGPSLCTQGANYIRNNRNQIVARYRQLAQQTAAKIGSSAEIIWLIEPDFVQYYRDTRQQGGTLSGSYMRSLFDDYVNAIKSSLPNARISWDISPWLSEQEMRTWWGFFSSANIDFIHTSGGRTNAGSAEIRNGERTWRFMSSLTGKKIIADAGYGVGGADTGHANEWDNVNNLKARISDGVIAISQHSPKSDWGNTIVSIRNSLPALC